MNDKPESNNPYLPKGSSNDPAPFAPYFSEPAQTPYGPTQPVSKDSPIVPAPYGMPVNSGSQQGAGYAQQDSYTQPAPYNQQGYGPSNAQPYYLQQPAVTPSNQLALIGFIIGLSQIFLGLVASVVAIIFGHIALHQMKTNAANNRWMAIAALSLGYIGLFLLGLIVFIWFLPSFFPSLFVIGS